MTTDSLFEQLKHPNPNLRERAMWQLAEVRDENTIPRLMSILDEEDVTYRRAAVKALGAIGVDAVPALVESLLNSDNATIRGSCAKALAQVAANHPDVTFPEEGLQGLKTALNDTNGVVYIASVMALGEIGSPAFEILTEALKTTDNVAVAVAIVNALGSMGDVRGVEVLTALTDDETVDPYVRESAVSALPRLDQVIKYSRK
ncbi:phycocyanin operon protein Z [Nostoc linckia z18]|jgi:bilin biosynthesis protein|uniref:Phycocyanin operon protein Z n=2 Tax=Nostoc linckia TaxID=92942 RepID=A0A9Q5Z6K7_NOSLI|nr:HEAT repeat domain-containing protein [Nostoc linckia]PHK37496.1 phycocyanin operon protein Z [Nostoc linckia z15]PHK40091.1 phycocyanin operon protein Z [Nostoc linckia z16]PHJ55999.1 phycocyanin operon protein Z [Nostoc linckia z1]PHJ63427.1 phycocyanin operon protein Z [Nostoc linckia z3]PHJ66207.1 phycocyanin operon protein Z [Nostoc linckia z2]